VVAGDFEISKKFKDFERFFDTMKERLWLGYFIMFQDILRLNGILQIRPTISLFSSSSSKAKIFG
jgi:hypothetical protein